jgi:hypothetical protein
MFGGAPAGRPSGRGSASDPDIPQGRARDLGQKTIEEFRKAQKEEAEAGEAGPERRMQALSGPRPRTVLSFARKVDDLLISGGLAGGEELAGTPALIDAPLGKGHIVMFGFNPMWRHETHGSYFLVFNAMMNFNNLDAK